MRSAPATPLGPDPGSPTPEQSPSLRFATARAAALQSVFDAVARAPTTQHLRGTRSRQPQAPAEPAQPSLNLRGSLSKEPQTLATTLVETPPPQTPSQPTEMPIPTEPPSPSSVGDATQHALDDDMTPRTREAVEAQLVAICKHLIYFRNHNKKYSLHAYDLSTTQE